jgi:iron complex outermembrane receptor protein
MSLTGIALLAARSLAAATPLVPVTMTPGGENGFDETFVTARKLAEPLADVPLSATVVGGELIEDSAWFELSDAAVRVPNVLFSEFSARRLSFPFVRGVGSGLNDPAVITYIDDVPQFGFGGTNLPLVAVERVEFLRGPQGTLYGKNALGGVMHVRGRRPTAIREIELGAGIGSYDWREYSGSYSGPIGGDLLADLAISDVERDGYTTNDFTGNDVDYRDALFGRARLLWSPTESSELDFSVFGENARDGGFVLSELDGLRARPHRIDQDYEGIANRDVLQPALAYRVFGDDHDFTSVSAWQTWDVLELSDFDFSPIDGVRRRAEEEQSYLYQELRLGTSESDGREARWLVGLSGFYADSERQAANVFRPDGAGIFFPPANVGTDLNDGQFEDLGIAAFGEVGVPLGEFELTGGIRYDREEKEVERLHTFDPGFGPIVLGQSEEDETFDEVLPMASLAWHVREDALVWVRAARGFKAGGFNLTAPVGAESFDSETNWTYELGWRQTFGDERYALAATAFLVDWEDMQLALFDAMSGGYVDNAGESESQGIELEAEAEITEGLDGFATFGLLDTEIEEYVDVFGTDTSGNELPFAPDSTWSVGLRYGGELASGARWTVAGDYGRWGSYFYDAGNREGDSYGLANVRLGLDGRSFGLSFWLQNAFDEEYVPLAFQPSPVDPTTFVGESGAPRVLGFSLSFHL